MRSIVVSIVVCIVAMGLGFQSPGQAPQLSATQNFLEKVDRKTCALRAQEIVKQFNFSISKVEGEEMVIAGNQDVAVAIFCDWCGTVVNVNISVASSRTDRDVVKLRDQILAYIATGNVTPAPATGGVITSTGKKLWLDKSTFSATEPVTVHFANLPGNPNDWITIVPVSQAINSPGPWKYTAGKKDGELKWEGGFPAGEYEVRLFFKDSYTLEERMTFKVTGAVAPPPTPTTGGVITSTGKKLWLDISTFSATEPVTVHFANLPGNTNDWITIVPVSQAINSPGPWKYTAGKKDGELKWEGGFPAGEYEVRLFFKDSYTLEDKLIFRVSSTKHTSANLKVSLEKNTYSPNQPVTVNFSGMPGNTNDWITIVPASQPINSGGPWKYTGGKTSGSLTWDQGFPAGAYEVRVFFKDSWDMEQRLAFVVK